jgi:hypothetical protein
LTKESKDLALLISKLQLGHGEMPFEDYLIMEDEDNIEVEYCMLELVDLVLGQRIEPLSFDLNAKPLDILDLDDRSTYCETSNYSTSCSIAMYIFMNNPLEFTLQM